MSSFTKPLILKFLNRPEKIKWYQIHKWFKTYKWFELHEEFEYYSDLIDFSTPFEIPKGFQTDFASIPRAFRMILSPIGQYGKAAVVHDFLCETKIVSRKVADKVFLEAMEVLEVSWIKRKVMYRSVRAYSIAMRIK